MSDEPAEPSSRTIRVRVLCHGCQADVTDVPCWWDDATDRIECNACHAQRAEPITADGGSDD